MLVSCQSGLSTTVVRVAAVQTSIARIFSCLLPQSGAGLVASPSYNDVGISPTSQSKLTSWCLVGNEGNGSLQ